MWWCRPTPDDDACTVVSLSSLWRGADVVEERKGREGARRRRVEEERGAAKLARGGRRARQRWEAERGKKGAAERERCGETAREIGVGGG